MPSVAMNPIFEELASNYPDVLFLVVDVDELKVIFTSFLNQEGGLFYLCYIIRQGSALVHYVKTAIEFRILLFLCTCWDDNVRYYI